MKTVHLSPKSLKHMKPITMDDDIRDERETYYFPGCRKDANCTCKMCLDSITATLDLMSMSVQRSSLTKLSASKPWFEKTPVSIDPTLLSTPTSATPPLMCPPPVVVDEVETPLRSTAKTGPSRNDVVFAKKRRLGFMWKNWRWVLLLGLILGLDSGFYWGVVRVFRPGLSGEIVRDLVQCSSAVEGLSERLILFQKILNDSVDGKMSSCIFGDSTWKINQDGLILYSYCTLYKSAAEEVLIWGWPLRTAGLLAAGFSSRSFSVLTGKVTEWPEGKIINFMREANTTWLLRKWSASVVQLEPNTWTIEYKRNPLLENPRYFMGAIDFTKFWIMKLMLRIRQQVWALMPDFRYYTVAASEAAGPCFPT